MEIKALGLNPDRSHILSLADSSPTNRILANQELHQSPIRKKLMNNPVQWLTENLFSAPLCRRLQWHLSTQ
jgi:hypothetical protein